MAVAELIYQALDKPNGRYFYIAPTFKQGKMIAWRMLHEAFRALPEDLRVKKNESELYVEIYDKQMKGTSMIEIKGADSPDSLRGVKLTGCVLDEYADIKPNVFDEILRPALADDRGWCWFIGTPRGYNHFYDVYNFANSDENDDWVGFKATTFDNPFIPPDEVEKARKDLNEDYFAQEYMAEFKRFTGLVYKEFDRDRHIIDQFDVSHMNLFRSIDFGTTNPFCCLWIAVDGDDNWYIYDEHYESEKDTEYHANVINGRSRDRSFVATYRDPSARQLELDFAKFGIYTIPAINAVNPTDVEIGISNIQSHLKIHPKFNKPKLFVFKHCHNIIKEFESYRWADKKDDNKNNPNVPVKKDDHACFTEDTLVKTIDGDKKIKDINTGELVLTPIGYRKVLESGLTGKHDVYKLVLNNNRSLKATGDHPILVANKGLVPLKDIQKDDSVIIDTNSYFVYKTIWKLKSLAKPFKSLIRKDIGYVASISEEVMTFVQRYYTELFGNTILGKYLANIMSTIKTIIGQTIRLRTWSLCHSTNTLNCTVVLRSLKNGLDKTLLQTPILKLRNGMRLKKVGNGMLNMLGKFGRNVKRKCLSVCSAGKKSRLKITRQSIVRTIVDQHSDVRNVKILKNGFVSGVRKFLKLINILKLDTVQVTALRKITGKRKVYNLKVEEAGLYYANNVCVSNCDALRYFANTYKPPYRRTEYEEYEHEMIKQGQLNKYTGY